MAIKLAMVGLQGHWYEITEVLPQLPEVELVAVVDTNPEALKRAPDFPNAVPDIKTFTDYHDLFAQVEADIVLEAGIDSTRAEILLACAERGWDFICEKPMAKSLAELEQVREAVAKSGVLASMLITMRCLPNYLAMREAVVQGLIGEVVQGGAQKSYRLGQRPEWQKHWETFSGLIPFVGIHVMDLFRWTSGREYVEVMAYASNVGHPGVGDLQDNACVLAKLDNGASAAFRLDYCRPAAAPTHGDDRLRLAGSKGVLESIDGKVTLITQEEGPRELPLPEPFPFFEDFLAARLEKRAPFIPFEDCSRITEVVLRAQEASETDKPVKL